MRLMSNEEILVSATCKNMFLDIRFKSTVPMYYETADNKKTMIGKTICKILSHKMIATQKIIKVSITV